MKKFIALAVALLILLAGCSSQGKADGEAGAADESKEPRVITDILGRQVELPVQVSRIAAIGGAARILTYAGCADRLVGVTEMDQSNVAAMPYSVVNAAHFQTIATVGTGGSNDTVYVEELVTLAPDVIFAMTDIDTVNDVQNQTGIPVVAVYPTELFDASLFDSLTLIGDIMGTRERCDAVVAYIKAVSRI
jgi:iron complex transport system substrate-binding protein